MINRADGTITDPIKVGCEHQWHLLGRPDLQDHFLVRRDRIKQASYMELELLVHEALSRLQRTGPIRPYHSEEALAIDFQRIKDIQRSYYQGFINAYPSAPRGTDKPGRAFVETFYDINNLPRRPSRPTITINYAFADKRILYIALQKLIRMTQWDLTIANVRRMLHRMRFGPKAISPLPYKLIFHQLLKPTGRVISDLAPGFGGKALACAALGAKYCPLSEFPVEMANTVGLELVKPTPTHDILIIDNNFRRVDIDEAMTWRDKCREMLVYVQSDQMEPSRIKYNPTRIIKIKTQFGTPKLIVDYLFHFK